jgi:hypothetical protein
MSSVLAPEPAAQIHSLPGEALYGSNPLQRSSLLIYEAFARLYCRETACREWPTVALDRRCCRIETLDFMR